LTNKYKIPINDIITNINILNVLKAFFNLILLECAKIKKLLFKQEFFLFICKKKYSATN